MRRIPEAQLEIMKVIWGVGEPITRSAIQSKMQDKKWKAVTLNTLLSRLVENGFLSAERQGKEYVYTALIAKERYLAQESRTILERLYQNSITNFMISLYQGNAFSTEEIEELEAFLKKLKGE